MWRSVCLNKDSNKHGCRGVTLMELSLLILGLKLFGSLLNVISSSDRKRFIPASRLWGLKKQTSRYRGGGRRADEAAQTRRFILRVGWSLLGGKPVKHDDSVGQVGRHDEVVLHHECCLLGVEDVPANKRRVTTAPHTGRDTRQQRGLLIRPFQVIQCGSSPS